MQDALPIFAMPTEEPRTAFVRVKHPSGFTIMALMYKLVERKNLKKGVPENSTQFYAQSVSTGKVELDEICSEISDSSTVNSADVKAVLDRLNFVLDKHMRAGRIVQLGEMGNFRFSLGSKGADSEDQFDASLIRTPRIVFAPGSKLRTARKSASYEKIQTQKVENNTVGG